MNLTARDFRVFVAIGAYADASGQAFPSVATISADTGINRRHVFYAINNLRKSGLLLTARRRDDSGDWGSTLYTIIHDEGVVLNTAPPSAADSTTVVLNTAPGVVPPEGTLTDHLTRPSNTGARRASQICAGGDESADWFETFWRYYPSRKPHDNPKKPARLKFEAAVKRGVDPTMIVRGAENFAVYAAAHISGPRFIKTAEVWLNKECWSDYQQPPEPEPLRAGMI